MHRNWMTRALVLAVLAAGFGSVALAHSTGHEIMNLADCQKLPNTDPNDNLRVECSNCIAKNSEGKAKFHWHPDMAKGTRCNPDDGKTH
jgi:hypothetical protein